jgi:hypothetical protein
MTLLQRQNKASDALLQLLGKSAGGVVGQITQESLPEVLKATSVQPHDARGAYCCYQRQVSCERT